MHFESTGCLERRSKPLCLYQCKEALPGHADFIYQRMWRRRNLPRISESRGSDGLKHIIAAPREAFGNLWGVAGYAVSHKEVLGSPGPSWTHRGFVFMEHLVVATQRDTEDDRCDILEAVDPLLAFWPLAPDIEEPAAHGRTITTHSSLVTRELQHSGHSLTIRAQEGSKHKAVGLSLLAWSSPPKPAAEEAQEEQLQTGMWGFVGEPQQRAGSQRLCGGGDHTLLTFICSKYCLCVAFCLCALFFLLDCIMRVNVLC